MIESIRNLGLYLKEAENKDPLKMLLEPLQLNSDNKILFLLFRVTDSEVVFESVQTEDFSRSKEAFYLYRSGSANGPNITPIAKITDLRKKTFPRKIVNWFKQNSSAGPISAKIARYFQQLSPKELEDLVKKMEEALVNQNQKIQHLLSIKVKQADGEYYIGQLEEFQEKLISLAQDRFSFQKSKGRSEGEALCLLCNQRKKVLGFASPFSFYNVDQKGFVYYFNQTNSWKQLPICLECALELQEGKAFLDKHLDFRFYGFKYYFVPKFIFGEIAPAIIEDLTDITPTADATVRKYENGPLGEEIDWQELLQQKGDSLSLLFLFYEKNQSRIIIRQFVEDVAPSWLNRLLTTFQEVINSHQVFNEESVKKLLGNNAEGNFKQAAPKWKRFITIWSLVREFYPSSKKEGIFDKYFIDIVGNILRGHQINYPFLISSFHKRFRITFNKEKAQLGWGLNFNALQAFLLHVFLLKMNLVYGDNQMIDDKIISNIPKDSPDYLNKIREFITENASALNSIAKRAIFLQGVITRFLLAIQYTNLGSTPFESKLFGLQLDQRKLKRLLAQVQAKFIEYRAGYYKPLEELIANYHLRVSDEDWKKLTTDEISYYFTLGLTIGNSFKSNNNMEE